MKEIKPNPNNFFIDGKYRNNEREGFFDIYDNANGIFIKHQYISGKQIENINNYNRKYKDKIDGKECSIVLYNSNFPYKRLKELFEIKFFNVSKLDLSRCQISSLAFLESEDPNLPNLQLLNLSQNQIKSIETLTTAQYPRLVSLLLNNNEIKSIACLINCNFLELEEINLSSNPIESIDGIESFNFPNLDKLILSRTLINDVNPLIQANFPSLVTIDLQYNKITSHKKKELVPDLFAESCPNLNKLLLN